MIVYSVVYIVPYEFEFVTGIYSTIALATERKKEVQKSMVEGDNEHVEIYTYELNQPVGDDKNGL